MILVSWVWDVFIYKVDPDLYFWSIKLILLALPYTVWWLSHHFGFIRWSQTLIVCSYMVFGLWHTIVIHPAYYIVFIQILVLSRLFWHPSRLQFFLQIFLTALCLVIGLYYAKEYPYTLYSNSARIDIIVDGVIFVIMIAIYHWYLGKIQENRRIRELNFADIGMKSSYLLHEISRPLNQISHLKDDNLKTDAITELRSLVDTLDGVAKGRYLEKEDVDVRAVVDELKRAYADYLIDTDVQFSCSGDCNLSAHRGALTLILKNLFLNAIEETSVLPQSHRRIEITISDKTIRISNPVLNPKKLKRHDFFTPGFTTKPGHQGMGLPLSAEVAKICGLSLRSKICNDEIVFTISAQA